MKKLNRLFAILIAVLGVGSLSAQTWTAPVIGQDLKDVNDNTELYMYNVKADAFASSGMSWGTHATVKELQNGDSELSADVHRCRVSKPTDGQLQIMLNEKKWLGGNLSNTNDCWVDFGSNNVYTYKEVSDNVYTLKPTTATNESYLDCAWAYGGHITFSATNGYGNTEWAFVLRSDITNGKYLLYKAKKEMYDIYQALVEAGHDGTYADALATANAAYTASNATAATVNAATKVLLKAVAPALSSKYFAANSLFNNPDMRGFGDDTDWGNGLNAFANGIFESWHSAETITQKQTGLPNGFYTVVFLGMYRQDGGDAAPTLTLTSGNKSAKANLKSLAEIDFGVIDGAGKLNDWTENWVSNKPNSTYSAGEALAHTDAGVKVENFVVENGELTITVAMPSGSQWLLCQGFEIYYKAESLDEYANLFYAAKAAAEAFNAEDLNTAAANQISAALSAAATEQVNKEWYQTRTEELNAAVALANEVKAPYANFKSLITLCKSTLNNSEEFEAGAANAFTTAINTAKDNVASATTAGDINAAYNAVEEARRVYIQKADPLNGELFDYTFMIANPGFDNGTNGWDCESPAQNKQINSNKTNGVITGSFFENWNPSNFTGTISQSISGLPSGKYLLKVAAFGTGANVFANNEQVEVTSGEGVWYEVEVAVSEGNLTFGIKNENATNWIGIDNASLYYKGFDVETAKNGISSLISQAESLVAEPMNKDMLAGLNETIGDAREILNVAYPTRKELNAMMEELNQAMDNANASIAEYEKIASYINMTAKFTDVSTYQQKYHDGLFANDEVESVRQELNVIRFTAASTDFANDIEVTGWTGSMGGKNTGGQHWDGTTGENATKYYDNNSWGGASHSTTTSITLPKGTYVLKAALRSHEKTTMTLTVLDQVVNVNGKGDTGYGIDTEGKANFSEDGDYANEDKGRGWEWEFVKFQLTEETEVTLKVECNYNGEFGWASFSDITLWMDDATYITVNSNVIKASLATAQALVNTKPMGTNENTALMTAIAQAEKTFSTPDELDNALEALNAAIAEANAWVSKYNEGKTLLVAALERFESEFNDGENGALRFIPEQNWKNILNAVMVVAEAKDKLDDYSNFAQAANKLHAAMDAVFAIYNEYKMLEDNTELIKNADCTSNDSWEGNGRTTYNDQHWSGTTRTYFAQNHENGAARSQTITLPKTGSYLLKVAVRAVEATSYVEFLINGTSYKTKGAHGHIGGTIATDGTEWENVETGIKAGKTFANDNKGFGWVYTYIYFNAKAGDNTIAINLSNCNSGREANCGGMELYYLRPNYVVEEENIVKHYGKFAEAINAICTTHDVTNATLTNNNIITTNPNTLIIANKDQVNNQNNVIVEGAAASLVLAEGYTFNSTTDFTAATLKYAREFSNNWLTVCLPFNYTIPKGVTVETLTEINTGEKTFTFEAISETMKANTPYIIKNSTGTATLFASLSNAEVEATPEAMEVIVDGVGAEFVGTYTTKTSTELMEIANDEAKYDILFFGTDGQLYYLSHGITTKNITFKPFRAYIRVPKGEIDWNDGQQARALHRAPGTTDIDMLESIDNGQQTTVIYDLMGRKVETMEKGGMYIVNGKKVIVK